MSTITKEFAQQKIAEMEARRDDPWLGLDEDDSNTLAALRIALASLEADAVADAVAWSSLNEERICDVRLRRHDINPGPLYTAPPAPVSVPAAMEMDDDFDSAFEHGKAVGWNAYRAAMLQGAEPVTAAYKLPSREHFILLCNQFWNWQEADEINAGEEEPRLEWNGSEFTNRVTQALWRMYQASPGNSPAIPDGYALVPVEPTAEMISSGIAAHYERSNIQIHDRPAPGPMECAYVAMLAAAPQQEVK